jgi:hypothetical protein
MEDMNKFWAKVGNKDEVMKNGAEYWKRRMTNQRQNPTIVP